MKKHLLLDLDGTLLGVNMGEFIPPMASLMEEYFRETLPGGVFSRALQAGYRSMLSSSDPEQTVMDVFLRVFSDISSLAAEETREMFDAFYRGPFWKLSSMATPVDGSGRVLETAAGQDYSITLATNPIFPLTAIRQRISWAGLPEGSFDLITSAERMHYCKPNPGYFREIMEILGAVSEECIMVGDDADLDLAARKIGITVFLVGDPDAGRGGAAGADYTGNLFDLVDLLPRLRRGKI